MRVLVVSTYELGHQPLHAARAAGALRAAGHEVRCLDLAVDGWDPSLVDDVDAMAVSLYMHTALRLALPVLREAEARRPGLPIARFGLYAGVAHDDGTSAFPGEYLDPLLAWAGGAGSAAALPARDLLPPLDRYARLLHAGQEVLVGRVEAARGCPSRCRHCPVPVVYDGRTRVTSVEEVVADVEQLVRLGAGHLSFGDPDFLGAPHHGLRTVRAIHEAFPDLTFDVTTKIDLVLRWRHLWPELADLGCLFTVNAVECVDDDVLRILDKGHTSQMASEAVGVLRAAGIEPRPSLLPFTPWTTRRALADLVRFVADHDLVANVDPVHWSIRLLLPDGSLLLDRPELAPYLDGYDPESLGWRWHPADPAMDDLQREVAALVEATPDHHDAFDGVADLVGAGVRAPRGARPEPPRLSESWFCCAEPTCEQVARSAGQR
jgi:hypothetical protein